MAPLQYHAPNRWFAPAVLAMAILTHVSYFHGDRPIRIIYPTNPLLAAYLVFVVSNVLWLGKLLFYSFDGIVLVTTVAHGAHLVEALYGLYKCISVGAPFSVTCKYVLGALLGGVTQLKPMLAAMKKMKRD